jgi:hypothetical protein
MNDDNAALAARVEELTRWIADLQAGAKADLEESKRLRQWIADLQSGMFVNCAYCGHQYGPRASTPTSQADVLKAHIAQCPEHPMSALLAVVARFTELIYEMGLTLPNKWMEQHRELGKKTGVLLEDIKAALQKAGGR